MRSHTIQRHMTPARRKWLEKLRDLGPSKRGRGPQGFQCMQLGWSEWDYRVGGEPVSEEEAHEKFGDGWHNHLDASWLERITAAGLAALEADDALRGADDGGGQW